MNLALIDNVQTLTKDQAIKYLKDLDLIFTPSRSAEDLKLLLLPAWQEGRKFLEEDNCLLLSKYRIRELLNLQKHLSKMYIPLSNLRAIARRVGINNTGHLNREKVFKQLELVAQKYIPSMKKQNIFNMNMKKKKPQSKQKRKYQFKGLTNLGNSCYFNAVMQCIKNCTEFTNTILSLPNPVPGGETIRALQHYLKVMSLPSKNTFFKPDRLLNAVKNIPTCIAAEIGLGGRQEDASELLTLLLSYLYDTIPQTSHLFSISIGSSILCRHCDYQNRRSDIKFQLSLHIPDNNETGAEQRHELTTLMKDFKKIEIVEYKCGNEDCHQGSQATKWLSLDNNPPFLIIQLVRFKGQEKVKDYVQFEQTLSTKEVSVPGDQHNMYTIFGIIVHLGETMASGHYKAYVKTHLGWREFDDDEVNIVSWDFVKRLQAYVIFYTKLG